MVVVQECPASRSGATAGGMHLLSFSRPIAAESTDGASPAVLADVLLAAETERTFADTGHSLDFINKAFECLDLIGFAALLDAFDRQRQVDLTARLVARHLMLGHSALSLIAALARALLREDAGFHAY